MTTAAETKFLVETPLTGSAIARANVSSWATSPTTTELR